MRYINIKRILDVILSGLSLVVLSPLLLLLALAVRLESKGPVLFRQKRAGKDNTYFYMLKFRTMKIDTPKDTPTHLLIDPEQYITRTGKFLRKTSLDELPQLLNIFAGEMSIIGPRPALWNQFDLMDARETYGANGIRPGLTGWAQINGRDRLLIAEKAKLDGEYCQELSFRFDLKIILYSVISVLKADGIREGGPTPAPGEEKMMEFTGRQGTPESASEEVTREKEHAAV